MADYNSSLPVRTENNGDVAAKIVDATTPSQGLNVDATGKITAKLNDGSGNAVTSQVSGAQRALDVGVNVAGVQVDPRAIRALTAADVVTAQQGTTPWVTQDNADGPVTPGTVAANSQLGGAQYNSAAPTLTTGQQAALQSDVNGNLKVNVTNGNLNSGVADKTAFTYGTSIEQTIGGVFQDTSPTLTAGQQGAVRLTANRGMHVNLRDASGNEKLGASTSALSIPVVVASDQAAFPIKLKDGAGTDITSQVNGAQRALDVGINVAGVQIDPRQIRALTSADVVSANLRDNTGAPYTTLNPLPVAFTVDNAGTEINNYVTASAVAAGATTTNIYTVTALKTMLVTQIEASGSGRMKMELAVETGVATGVYTSKFVQFNSTSSPNTTLILKAPLTVAAGVRVRVTLTNRDLLPQDLYSTISGQEV